MLINKKILFTIICCLFLTPYLTLAQNIIWDNAPKYNDSDKDTCADRKGYDTKSKKSVFVKCCLSTNNPDPKKWNGGNAYSLCSRTRTPTAGWDCYCRWYNLSLNSQTTEQPKVKEPLNFIPQITIPDSDFKSQEKYEVPENTALLGEYIVAIFKYSIGIIGIIAVIVLMFGGARWLTAGGNSQTVSEAKTYITGSLSGLVLVLGSFLILSTINTNLVDLKIINIKSIKKIDLTKQGCCEKITADGTITTEQINQETCKLREKDFKTVNFDYGKTAENNKCVENKTKKACCLYGKTQQLKDTDLWTLCESSGHLSFEEGLIDFTNTCKEKADKLDQNKYVKGRYTIEEAKVCNCQDSNQFCKCVDIKE